MRKIDRLGVAEDVARAEEAGHGAADRGDGDLGGDRGRCALGIRELLASADRTERDVVGDDHADRGLDLLGLGPEHRTEDRRRCNGAVDDMVNLVGLEREDLRQTPADLVEAEHGLECVRTVTPGHLGTSDADAVEVVVAKLAGGVTECRVVSKVGAVGIPLTHG